MADRNPDLEAALQAEFRRGFELGETNQRLRCGDCTNTIAARVRAQVAAEIAEAIERLCPVPSEVHVGDHCDYRHAAQVARQHATDDHQETPK